jgi:integrase
MWKPLQELLTISLLKVRVNNARNGGDKMARPYKYYSCCRKKECLCSVKGKHKWIAERGRSNFDRGSTKTFDTLREAEAWLRIDEVPKKEINFKFGRLAELFLDNTKPNKKIKGIKPGSPVFAPSDKEVQKYLEFFHKNETHYHFFYMLATTGCRMSEMRTLKWDSVDFTRKTLSVMDSKSEAGIRTITINDTQIELLQKQKQNLQLGFLERNKMLSDQDFVFCNLKTINNPESNGMYAENTFTSLWIKKRNQLFLQQQIYQVSDDEKVRRFNCHDLRHYHASVLIKSGKNILQISQRLGHGSVEVTLNVYGHLFADDQDNSSDIATEKLPLLE